MEQVFNWTIRLHDGCTPEAFDWAYNHASAGTLTAARDAARDYDVRIELTDDAGFSKFRVSPDGYETA